jgi:hypothetical protein
VTRRTALTELGDTDDPDAPARLDPDEDPARLMRERCIRHPLQVGKKPLRDEHGPHRR